MGVNELLGYARSLLDSYGLTYVITAIVIIGVAVAVYNRFVDRS